VATASGSTDADGDPITYYYKFYNVNDSLTKQDYGTDSSYVIQKADAHDTIRVYTKAYDGSAYSGEYYTDTAISNSAPTPSFGADKTITNNVIEINTSESIAFTDSSSDADGDSPLSYSWAFGDGGTSTEQNPTYRYWIAGNFTVNLTVTDSYGDSNYNNTITVKVKEKIVCNNIYNPSTGRAGRNFISWGRRSAKRADKVAKLLGLNPKDLIGRYNTTTGTYETYLVDELLEADWYVQPYDVLKVEILNSSTGPITVTLDPHDSVNPKRSIRLKNTYNKTTKSGNPGYNYITYSNLTTTTASAFAQYMGIPRGWVLSKRSGNRWQGYIVDISPSSYDFTIYPNDILCAKVPPSLNDTTKDVGSDM
jgi:PKD repeat protein